MTDDEFVAVCVENPDLCFETTAEGELVVTPLNYTLHGVRNAEIGVQFGEWARRDDRGVVIGSGGIFVLPSGARRAADTTWVSREQISRLSPEELERFWPLCPEFVIELRCIQDEPPVLRAKMREWIENGAELAWLIDPKNRTVEIFRVESEPTMLQGDAPVYGEGPIDGFVLDPRPIWGPLDD